MMNYAYGNNASYNTSKKYEDSATIQDVSKPMSQTFPGYPHSYLSKKVSINMGPKVNRFRDINLRSYAGTRLIIT